MQNLNLGMDKMTVIPENPVFPNPLLPKTSVFVKPGNLLNPKLLWSKKFFAVKKLFIKPG